jgi:hypothetical protein
MYVCILDAEGAVLVSKNIPASPEPFLELIAPYREDRTVAAECIQELLGHSHVDTTMIYTHVLNRGTGVLRPLDDALMLPAPSEPVRSN